VGELRHILKGEHTLIPPRRRQTCIQLVVDLMHENATLRSIIKNLSSFIGDGTAGAVSTYGFNDVNEFNNYINRSETDTAVEGFQRRKRLKEANGGQMPASPPTTSSADTNANHKRPAERGPTNANKRPRTSSVDSGASNTFPSLIPMTQSNNSFPDLYSARQDETLFSDLFRGPAASGTSAIGGPSAMFTNSPSSDLSSFASQTLPQSQQPYVSFPPSQANLVNSTISSSSYDQVSNTVASRPTPSTDSNPSPEVEESSSPRDAKGTEAAKLIL
jgi:hypothetical protein